MSVETEQTKQTKQYHIIFIPFTTPKSMFAVLWLLNHICLSFQVNIQAKDSLSSIKDRGAKFKWLPQARF